MRARVWRWSAMATRVWPAHVPRNISARLSLVIPMIQGGSKRAISRNTREITRHREAASFFTNVWNFSSSRKAARSQRPRQDVASTLRFLFAGEGNCDSMGSDVCYCNPLDYLTGFNETRVSVSNAEGHFYLERYHSMLLEVMQCLFGESVIV